MLYKVTPMMTPESAKAKKPREPGAPRKKRKSAIYDADGHEVLITLMCLKCRQIKPLVQFGLRKMADGAIRNQPWCRPCRGGSSATKASPKSQPENATVEAASVVDSTPVAAPSVEASSVTEPRQPAAAGDAASAESI